MLVFRGLALAAVADPDLPVALLVVFLRPKAPALCLLVPAVPLTALVVAVGTVALGCFLLGGTSRGFTAFPTEGVLVSRISEQRNEKEEWRRRRNETFVSVIWGGGTHTYLQTQLDRKNMESFKSYQLGAILRAHLNPYKTPLHSSFGNRILFHNPQATVGLND